MNKEKEEKTLYDDANAILEKAIKLIGNKTELLPSDGESMENAMFKILSIVQELSTRLENKQKSKIITLS